MWKNERNPRVADWGMIDLEKKIGVRLTCSELVFPVSSRDRVRSMVVGTSRHVDERWMWIGREMTEEVRHESSLGSVFIPV